MTESRIRPLASAKALQFTESVIREMTRFAVKHDAANLAQGFPDFPAPTEIKANVLPFDARKHEQAIAQLFLRPVHETYRPDKLTTTAVGGFRQ